MSNTKTGRAGAPRILRIEELDGHLDGPLDSPQAVLDTLVNAAAKGQHLPALFDKLHAAAAAQDKLADVAFAYESLGQDRRLKLVNPELQAAVLVHAATFFADVFADPDGATAFLERALTTQPGHAEAALRFERILAERGDTARLAKLYLDLAIHEKDPANQFGRLRQVVEVAADVPALADITIDALARLNKLDPNDNWVRDALDQRLVAAGRAKDSVKVLEAALGRDPAPNEVDAFQIRTRLLELYTRELREPHRAVPHVEALLAQAPGHTAAREVAESLLDNRVVSARVAAALSDAYFKLGLAEQAAQMLNLELKTVRGPRRLEVQRRLAYLRQDAGDPAGALELLGPVVSAEPGEDEARRRFVELSLNLNQPAEAAKLLNRALGTCKDPAIRARVGAEIGTVHLRSGDLKKAEAAFKQVIEDGSDPSATLIAARALADLHDKAGDLRALGAALELIARFETQPDPRNAAARRLAKLAEGELNDPARAISAYRALIDSPWADDALKKLSSLYEEAGDFEGLIDVTERRAQRAKEPGEGRHLMFRAAELRTSKGRDRSAALGAWRAYLARFGPARDAHAQMIPLLEQEKQWKELAWVLERDIEQAPLAEWVPLLCRLAQLRVARLDDVPGGLEAYKKALETDPSDKVSRAAVEKLLASGDARLEAADILEGVYRDEEPGTGLLKVLETRADLASDASLRLGALEEALNIASSALKDPERALEIAGRGLALVVDSAPAETQKWLERVQRHGADAGRPEERARVLVEALGDRAIEGPELQALTIATGEALALAGDLGGAVRVYRRALTFEPENADLLGRVDELLAEQGSPEERLALYEEALGRGPEPARKQHLLHSMARLLGGELRRPDDAIRVWQAALAIDPRDPAAHQALVDAFRARQDVSALYSELVRALVHHEGERRNATLLAMAEVAAEAGDAQRALEHYRELLAHAEPADSVLENIELLAHANNDADTMKHVLERRIAVATAPEDRAQLLEKLGLVQAKQLADAGAAATSWLLGARAADAAGDDDRARRMYERVLGVSPDEAEAARRLIELYAAQGTWEKIPEAFAVLHRTGSDERDVTALFLGLEPAAAKAGAVDVFVVLSDGILARDGLDPARARQVLLSRARVLSQAPDHKDEVAAIYRRVLQMGGDDVQGVADAFNVFLAQSELTPARVADRRWLFEWRAARASDPTTVLIAWAVAEETTLASPGAAIELYQRVLDRDPERVDAMSQLARLQASLGDAEGALASLRSLRDRSHGDEQNTVDLGIAALLVEKLARPLDALPTLERLLDALPHDPEVTRLLRAALTFEEARGAALVLLERMAESADSPEARADLFQNLIEIAEGVPALDAARARWYKKLLDSRDSEPEAALEVATRAAAAVPGDAELWDFAERLARRVNRPEPVAAAYAEVLDRALTPELAEELGRRFVEFNEEWFEDAERVVALLVRVLELCPGADWAFDRLKLAFNNAARWPELFALYDRALERESERNKNVELLREAAMAAKDFAADGERAIGYLERLNALAPGDARVEASLERLYEREGRIRPLIALLTRRIEQSSGMQQADLVCRVARLWLDLGDPVEAYTLLEGMLADPSPRAEVHELLERLVSLPSARDSLVPGEERQKRRQKARSVRHAAAELLCKRYEGQGRVSDVARMLEVELELAETRAERVQGLQRIIALRLESMDDPSGAFEALAQVVALEPSVAEHREKLAELAKATEDQHRRADLLVTIADGVEDRATMASLLLEAARVRKHETADAAGALPLFLRVLEECADDRPLALQAARELEPLLDGSSRALERVGVLEKLAELEDTPAARKAALGSAAKIAGRNLRDWPRAIRAWRARLADDESDLEALDGLADAVAAAGDWPALIEVLEARARVSEPEAARRDRVFVARLWADQVGDPERAVAAWRALRRELGPDPESYEALAELLQKGGRFGELAALTHEEAGAAEPGERRDRLLCALGETHLSHTGELEEALDSFVLAGAWDRALAAVEAPHEGARQRKLAERLLETATQAWTLDPDASQHVDAGPGRAVAEGLEVLARRWTEEGELARVVEQKLEASKLPFPRARQRELVSEAACLCSDRLNDSERALGLFRRLFAEDPADAVAQAAVTRFALLLEEQKLDSEIVALWEEQAKARAALGENGAAAALYARAADLALERLGAPNRAIQNHRAAADLGSDTSLEALARILESSGRHDEAAAALEQLCERSSKSELGARALRLAEAYLAAGRVDLGRARLESASAVALDAAPVRARLAELYRSEGAHAPLAALLSAEAERQSEPKTRLKLLEEAARLRLERLNAPEEAVPLLVAAIELAPDEPALRRTLALAFTKASRFDEALEVLRQQVERYGTRKPKDRALVHFQIARVSLAAGRRAEAIAELDFANKIDPAHPGILQALARLAFEEGQLERAEKQYRALLLVLGRDDDDAPSRAEALLDLAEIAERNSDSVRAAELVDSAFEAALESPKEADALESTLRSRTRYDLLARALEGRLERTKSPAEAARALADLAFLHAEHLGGLSRAELELRQRAQDIQRGLERDASGDDRAWAALGRVYDWLGDVSAEADVLERRVAGRAAGSEADAAAFYRLAQIRLADPATAARGFEVLESALELAPDLGRAEALLREAIARAPGDERAIVLFERVARAQGDDRNLADALALVSKLPGARPETLREGVELADRLERPELARELLETAMGKADSPLSGVDLAWAALRLAELLEHADELPRALTLRELAARELPVDEARKLRSSVAARALDSSDLERARRIYEALGADDPADREVWEPLASVYRKLGATAELVELIERTVPLVAERDDRVQLRLEQAEILLLEGKARGATTILEEVLEEDPSQRRAADRLLAILEQEGATEQRIELLVSQIDTAKDRQDVPRIVELSLTLGRLLESEGRAADAYDVYVAVLDWDKSHRDVLEAVLRLAELRDDNYVVADVLEALLQVERGEAAVELASRLVSLRTEQGDEAAVDRALELGFIASPTTEELRDPLLERFAAMDDWQGACRVLGQAVQVVPGDRELLRRLIEAHQRAGTPGEALALLDAMPPEVSREADVSRARAALLSEVGRDDEAILALEAAFALDPDAALDLLTALERAYARADMERAREIGIRLAEVLERTRDVDGARTRLAELGKRYPKDREVARAQAELEGRAERWDAASTAYRRLIALEEGDALTQAALALGDACERAGRFGDARGGLERALAAAPSHVELRRRLRSLYEAVGDNRSVAEFVLGDAAAEQDVGGRVALLLEAGHLLLLADGDPERALGVLEEVRRLTPDGQEAVVLSARAYAALGRAEEAMALLGELVGSFRGRRARELSPVYREMSRIQLAEGYLSEALASLTKAFEMDMKNARLAMELGQLALDMDEVEVAGRAFRGVTMLRAGEDESGEPVTMEVKAHAQYQLAVLAERAGDVRRAKMLAQKALSDNPHHDLARQLLATLDRA